MSLLWDIANSNGATLSMGGQEATVDSNAGTGQGAIRGTIGWATGKRYYEGDVVLFDGIAIGATTTDATNFPGFISRGAAFLATGTYQNNGSGFTFSGGNTIDINAPMRLGVQIDIEGQTAQLVGPSGPVPSAITFLPGGGTVYPSFGTGYGLGVSHLCSVIVYGIAAQFTLPYDTSFLPWSAPVGGGSNFFAVL